MINILLYLAAMSLLLTSCAPPRSISRPAPVGGSAGAEAYYQWLTGCLHGLEQDLPAITASAERAAALYVQDGWEIGASGDRGLVGEFNSRAGGLARTNPTNRPEALERPDWHGIVLVFPREDTMLDDLARAAKFHAQGKWVILFGNPGVREAAQRAGVTCDAFVDNHAAPHGGLFPTAGGAWVVPTDPPADVAAVWTWTGEFVGALTRLGKMPPMAQSIMVPGADARGKKYEGLKFHAETPQKIAPGQLGREYLAELLKALSAVHEQELGRIVQVAAQAVAARQAGHKVHVFAHGHAIRDHVAVPHDTGLFHQVNNGLFELKKDHGIAKGDFVFCVGYDRIFEGGYYKDDTTKMRAAGASLAWSLATYSRDPEFSPAALPKGEINVGQHWDLGDAVATVPGYDVKILPPSGVIAEAIFRMTEAQMLAMTGESVAPGRTK